MKAGCLHHQAPLPEGRQPGTQPGDVLHTQVSQGITLKYLKVSHSSIPRYHTQVSQGILHTKVSQGITLKYPKVSHSSIPRYHTQVSQGITLKYRKVFFTLTCPKIIHT